MTNFNLLLLQVLEYLAMREILTLEHINGGPPCAGRERLENIAEFCLIEYAFQSFLFPFPENYAFSCSFRESILSFTEHDDKQVLYCSLFSF